MWCRRWDDVAADGHVNAPGRCESAGHHDSGLLPWPGGSAGCSQICPSSWAADWAKHGGQNTGVVGVATKRVFVVKELVGRLAWPCVVCWSVQWAYLGRVLWWNACMSQHWRSTRPGARLVTALALINILKSGLRVNVQRSPSQSPV